MRNNYLKLVPVILLVFLVLSCSSESSDTTLNAKDGFDVKWNFKNFKKLKYNFSQVNVKNGSGLFGFGNNSFNKVKGTVIISVKENGKADLVFKDMENGIYLINESGDTSLSMSQKVNDFFIQDIDENGKVHGKHVNGQDLFEQLLFPLPSRPLKKNENQKVPISMPFNMYGSSLDVKGYNEISLGKVEKDLIEFTTKLDVSEMEIPEDADVDYECYMKGESNYTFDMAEGFFTDAHLVNTTSIKSNSAGEFSENGEIFKKDSLGLDFLKQMTKSMDFQMTTTIKMKLINKE